MTTELNNSQELTLTESAQNKLNELLQELEENVQGVRVFATLGGCSGVNFGMTFAEILESNDIILTYDDVKVIVDDETLEYLRGVEIDFIDPGDGQATFVFKNLPQIGSGCSSCGSAAGGGCA